MNRLKELRKKHNYSLNDMAKMLNISKAYYFQLEKGKRRLFYFMAVNIADIFKLTPDDIFLDDFRTLKHSRS